MLELLSLFRVVSDVHRDVRKRVEADCMVNFNQPHSAIKEETGQLPKHHVVLIK